LDYISHSDADRSVMLEAIGLPSVEELVNRVIPEQYRLDSALKLPEGASECALVEEFKLFAGDNVPAGEKLCFLGGGAYDHYIPAAIEHIISRSEFCTAYTPYQAEVSQGTLQTIYEFQTMVCRLTGMEASNASHYDGASALAEGVLLAVRKTRRKVVVLPAGLNPDYRRVVETYCAPTGIDIRRLDGQDGRIDLNELEEQCRGAGAVVVQHPNFYGLIEPVRKAARVAHDAGALVVSSTYPTTLSLLEPPGEWGADIATAEGQPFGVPLSLGGPYVGLFAVRKELVRMMPGRLVARTKDTKGQDGYVLTLQTREQHIRREKATSNICTNQALVALSALVYLSLMGGDGLRRAALNSYRGAHYLAGRLSGIPGCRLRWNGGFWSEFVLELPGPAAEIRNRLLEHGIFAGPELSRWEPGLDNCLLVAVTERRTRDDLDRFYSVLNQVVSGALTH